MVSRKTQAGKIRVLTVQPYLPRAVYLEDVQEMAGDRNGRILIARAIRRVHHSVLLRFR